MNAKYLVGHLERQPAKLSLPQVKRIINALKKNAGYVEF